MRFALRSRRSAHTALGHNAPRYLQAETDRRLHSIMDIKLEPKLLADDDYRLQFLNGENCTGGKSNLLILNRDRDISPFWHHFGWLHSHSTMDITPKPKQSGSKSGFTDSPLTSIPPQPINTNYAFASGVYAGFGKLCV